MALAAAIALAGGWEQSPSLGNRGETADNVARWNANQALTAALESSLPPHAMIFQLPVVPFPEAAGSDRCPTTSTRSLS